MPLPSATRKFPYILVTEAGDVYGINSREQAVLYAKDAANVIYDVERGTQFEGLGDLPEAELLEDEDCDEDLDYGEEE